MTACTVLEQECTKAMHGSACRQKGLWSNPGATSTTKCGLQHCTSAFHQAQVYLYIFYGKQLFALTVFSHHYSA